MTFWFGTITGLCFISAIINAYVCMHVAFSDSRMQVALSESQELDVHPEGKQF